MTSTVSQEEVVSLITKAVTDVSNTKVAGITPETKLADLNLDSLAAMEILMKVESDLKSATGNKSLSLPDNLLSESSTVHELAIAVYGHVTGGA